MRNLRDSLAVALLLLTAAAAWAAEEKKIPWKISGQLEEACSCDAACPCWFDSKPTRMHCSGGQVVFIEKGTYGSVPLDGLAIAQMGQSPDGETMMQSYGRWDFANIYIDEKANPEQRRPSRRSPRPPLLWGRHPSGPTLSTFPSRAGWRDPSTSSRSARSEASRGI